MASADAIFNVDEILICTLCSGLLLDPFTLKQCYHTFCKNCVLGLNWKTHKGKAGVYCPKCKTFSPDTDVRRNQFIQDLLEKQTVIERREIPCCRQCSDFVEARYRCTDCKIYLCDRCKGRHLSIPMLRGHNIVTFTGVEDPIVDNLITCAIHRDKPIEFNCVQCEKMICINCKIISHETHPIETIDSALDRIKPIVQSNITKLKLNVVLYNASIKKLTDKIEEVQQEYSRCREDIQKHADDAIVKIRASQAMLEYDLKQREEAELGKLTEYCEEIKSRKEASKNFCKVVTLCLNKSRHMSLLAEIQGSLFRNLEINSKPVENVPEINIPKPRLVPQYDNIDMLGQQDFLGILQFGDGMPLFSIKTQGKTYKSKFMEVDLALQLSKQLKKDKTILLPFDTPALHVSLVNGSIWICISKKAAIEVYTKDGILEQKINFPDTTITPQTVQQITHIDIIMACNETGLYEITTKGNITQKISEGKFCDLCVYDAEVYALELENQQVMVYIRQANMFSGVTYSLKHRINIESNMPSLNVYSTLIINQNSICVCPNAMPIYKFDKTGNFIRQLGEDEQIASPAICGTDLTSSLLISEYERNCLIIIDSNGKYKSCYPHNIEKPTSAVVFPDCIWLLQESNKKLTWKLVKYLFTDQEIPDYNEAYQYKPAEISL